MTILRIVSRGLDRKTYDVLRDALDLGHQHPLGLIMHGVSETDGKIQVAQVWESQEYAQRFDDEQLAPLLQANGATQVPEVTTFELEDLITP